MDVLNQGIKRSLLDTNSDNLQTLDDPEELKNIPRQFQAVKDRYASDSTLTHSFDESKLANFFNEAWIVNKLLRNAGFRDGTMSRALGDRLYFQTDQGQARSMSQSKGTGQEYGQEYVKRRTTFEINHGSKDEMELCKALLAVGIDPKSYNLDPIELLVCQEAYDDDSEQLTYFQQRPFDLRLVNYTGIASATNENTAGPWKRFALLMVSSKGTLLMQFLGGLRLRFENDTA